MKRLSLLSLTLLLLLSLAACTGQHSGSKALQNAALRHDPLTEQEDDLLKAVRVEPRVERFHYLPPAGSHSFFLERYFLQEDGSWQLYEARQLPYLMGNTEHKGGSLTLQLQKDHAISIANSVQIDDFGANLNFASLAAPTLDFGAGGSTLWIEKLVSIQSATLDTPIPLLLRSHGGGGLAVDDFSKLFAVPPKPSDENIQVELLTLRFSTKDCM